MRTSEQIKTEIAQKFGFLPTFFEPAQQHPQVLENLWQQTLCAYVNNPLPSLFKEKLFAYLSRYCAIPYCVICHSCCLRQFGLKAREVLELLETPAPTAIDIESQLNAIALQQSPLTVLPSNSALEKSLLYCSTFIFLEPTQAERCRHQLRRILGYENYQHLVLFLSYVKTSHSWVEAYPELAYEADQRVQNHLSALLEDEPRLADFFGNYNQRVRRERQSREEQILVELDECKRKEEQARLWQSTTQAIAPNQIRVRIGDNGPGIPSDIKDHIFDPFFTTKPVGKGTGLGLSICYQVIEKHRGQISVSSHFGQGTEASDYSTSQHSGKR